MKVHIINHRCGDDEIEVKNGIRVFDWVGNEFIINLNNFGELEINGLNEGLCIIPQYGNQIVIKMHGIIYGKWTFVKRGENFGIKLIKVLPKIHKISLDMIAKDIFRP